MIDFDEVNQRQQDGLMEIDSLQEEEKAVLQHYCSLATEELLKRGVQRKARVDQLVMNAYKYGIALGLKLSVANGEVLGRQ